MDAIKKNDTASLTLRLNPPLASPFYAQTVRLPLNPITYSLHKEIVASPYKVLARNFPLLHV